MTRHSSPVKKKNATIHAYQTYLKCNYVFGDNNDDFELVEKEDESECVLVKRDERNLIYK
jgi:hypothetical protein